MEDPGSTGASPRHRALFYRTTDDYLAALTGFLLGPVASDDAALIAVPAARHSLLRQALVARLSPVPSGAASSTAAGVALLADATAKTILADMTELGRNPGRILPAIHNFICSAAGARTRIVTESIWPGRSAAEVREATKHEALVNLAFAGADTQLLCLYDASRLGEPVIDDACRTHPLLAAPEHDVESALYSGAGDVPADCDQPLPPIPPDATVSDYHDDLRTIRRLVADQAKQAELPAAKAVDFVLAASEIAANTLRHTGSGGKVSLWQTSTELVCQLDDTGHIADPLAGAGTRPGPAWRARPLAGQPGLRSGRAAHQRRGHRRPAAPTPPDTPNRARRRLTRHSAPPRTATGVPRCRHDSNVGPPLSLGGRSAAAAGLPDWRFVRPGRGRGRYGAVRARAELSSWLPKSR